MSDYNYNVTFQNPFSSRVVCVPKRVFLTYLTYAPLVSFVLSIITLPGHVILFPYYLTVILSRGRPPKALFSPS